MKAGNVTTRNDRIRFAAEKDAEKNKEKKPD
jgi:hypothetical protein